MLNKLTDRFVKTCANGSHSDGEGLILIKSDKSSKWVFRFSLHGRRPEMGLGTYPQVSLAMARKAAADAREAVYEGRNPIEERKHAKELMRRRPTIEALIHETFEARKNSMKQKGAVSRWLSPLSVHVIPKIGHINIEDVTQRDIERTLRPLWHEKPETASRALQRLSMVFRHALAGGLRVDTQACDNAKALLGKQADKSKRIPSMNFSDVPEYFSNLSDSPTDLAMKLIILTATRSAEARCAHERELHNDVWILSADRMKNGSEHRIPITDAVQDIFDKARPFSQNGYFFVGTTGKAISDMTLSMKMKRQGLEARPHGFRASFRTWVSECTDTPREIAEEALSHVSAGKVELAYRRTDYLDKRRVLMQRWTDYVLGCDAKVVKIHG